MNLQKQSSLLTVVLTVCLLCFTLSASALTAKGALVSVDGTMSKMESKAVVELALRGEAEIRWLFRNTAATVPIRFVAKTDKRTLRSTGCVFPLDHTQSVPIIQNHVTRALLYRRIIAKQGEHKLKPRHIPDWLVAAVQYRAAARVKSRSAAHWYDVTRLLAKKKRLPELRTIVNLPVPPSQPLAYDLYADLAGTTLQSLLRADPGIVPKLIAQTKPLQTPYKALLPLIPIKDKKDAAIESWFTERVNRLLKGVGMDRSPADTKQALQQIETVLVPVPEGNGKKKEVPLDQVREVDPAYKFAPRDLDRRLEQLYRLQFSAPPLLQPAVREYIKAVTYLRHKGERKFRKHLTAAREMLEKSHKRSESISKLLIDLEKENYSPASRLVPYQPFFAAELTLTEFEKALQSLLEGMEKRLEEKQ